MSSRPFSKSDCASAVSEVWADDAPEKTRTDSATRAATRRVIARVIEVGLGARSPREGSLAGVLRALAELEGDAKELIVLRHAVGPREAPCLDLPGVGRDGQVGDERVLGLAGPVADDRPVAGRRGHADGVEGLGQRADLIEL